MNIFTFEQQMKIQQLSGDTFAKIDPEKQYAIYDLFDFKLTQKLMSNLRKYPYSITRETEGRMDLVSLDIYKSADYVEELMLLNNMCNSYALKEGDVINIISFEDLKVLQKEIDKEDKDIKKSLVNKNKDSKIDPNRDKLPPSIKPDGEKQIEIDTKSKIIKIIK